MAKIRYTNENKYALSIAVWLADDDYDHAPVEGPYMSVTGLLKPERMIVLNQRIKAQTAASDAVEEMDIERFIASRLGTAIHSAIEHSWSRKADKLKAFIVALQRLGYQNNVISLIRVNPTAEELKNTPGAIPVYMEQRAYKKAGNYTIGGKFDFIGNGTLEDFKSMGVYGYMKGDKDEEQLMQGSLYRWLNPDLVTSDVMRIQQIFTDWSKLDAMKKSRAGYPQTRILEKTLQLKTIEEIETWVTNKVNKIESLMEVPEPELPRCTQKELWQADPVYKYYGKAGAKRASKVFDNDSAAAYAWMESKGNVGEVREIGGMVKRCGYCSAFEICTQKDEYIAAKILQMP